MSDRMLDKVAALLKQSEGTDNEAEAAVFLAKAQTLATQYAVDLELARLHQAQKETRETPTTEVVMLGDRGQRNLARFVDLFLRVAEQNDVKCNIAHNSTYVVCFGFPSDIEVTKTLYGSLVVQMVSAADVYIRSGEHKKETRWVDGHYDPRTYRWIDGQEKPVDGRIARGSFYEGFSTRIAQRLREARQEAREQVVQVNPDDFDGQTEVTGALVLVGKEVEVADYYNQNSNARGSWKGARSVGSSSGSRAAGRTAGATARLGAQRGIGGSRAALSA